jgi:hypothetical protein
LGRALTTYLQDHLAGAIHAIELLKALRDHHAGKPLGQFATELLIETEADRDFAIEWRPVPLPLRFETPSGTDIDRPLFVSCSRPEVTKR